VLLVDGVRGLQRDALESKIVEFIARAHGRTRTWNLSTWRVWQWVRVLKERGRAFSLATASATPASQSQPALARPRPPNGAALASATIDRC
jgi:hypothetical protein